MNPGSHRHPQFDLRTAIKTYIWRWPWRMQWGWISSAPKAFAHVADEGLIQSAAAELLRYCRAIGVERVQVWADVKKQHSSHAIMADVGIGDTAHAVELMRGDAVIVTGSVRGDPPKRTGLVEVKRKTRLRFISAPA